MARVTHQRGQASRPTKQTNKTQDEPQEGVSVCVWGGGVKLKCLPTVPVMTGRGEPSQARPFTAGDSFPYGAPPTRKD